MNKTEPIQLAPESVLKELTTTIPTTKEAVLEISKMYDLEKRGSIIRLAEMIGTTSQVVAEWFALNTSKRKGKDALRSPNPKFFTQLLTIIARKPELICKTTGPALGTRYTRRTGENAQVAESTIATPFEIAEPTSAV